MRSDLQGVSPTGSAPLRYQWGFYSKPVSGATNATFTLSNISEADAGPYTVVVSHNASSTTSNRAYLNAPTVVALSIVRQGGTAVIEWPATCPDYMLEESNPLNPIDWRPTSGTVSSSNGRNRATVPVDRATKFLRLRSGGP